LASVLDNDGAEDGPGDYRPRCYHGAGANDFGQAIRKPEKPEGLSTYLIRIARLGGYLARANDAPPGNTVLWRGLCRLTDIQFGFLLAKGDVGN
jgi:hypothetical protein